MPRYQDTKIPASWGSPVSFTTQHLWGPIKVPVFSMPSSTSYSAFTKSRSYGFDSSRYRWGSNIVTSLLVPALIIILWNGDPHHTG